jgi:hypothetical protein
MRSRSGIAAAWVVGLTVAAVVATLGCGGGGGEDSGIQLNSVAYGNGVFVAVGDSDKAFANPGTGWTPFVTGVSGLDGIAWSRRIGMFVAVGDGGTILTSEDGVGWVPQASPTTFDLFGIAADDAGLIAVGDGGTILTSVDGANWTPRNSGTDVTLFGVAVGPAGSLVAVGAGGAVLSSTDGGQTWLVNFVAFPDVAIGDLKGVVHGTGGWVVVGDFGLILQFDVIGGWNVRANAILPDLNGVVFLQGNYTVLGDKGRILTSPDAVVFTQVVSNTGQFLYGAAFGGGTYYAVGSGGRALRSFDGAIYQDTKI